MSPRQSWSDKLLYAVERVPDTLNPLGHVASGRCLLPRFFGDWRKRGKYLRCKFSLPWSMRISELQYTEKLSPVRCKPFSGIQLTRIRTYFCGRIVIPIWTKFYILLVTFHISIWTRYAGSSHLRSDRLYATPQVTKQCQVFPIY